MRKATLARLATSPQNHARIAGAEVFLTDKRSQSSMFVAFPMLHTKMGWLLCLLCPGSLQRVAPGCLMPLLGHHNTTLGANGIFIPKEVGAAYAEIVF